MNAAEWTEPSPASEQLTILDLVTAAVDPEWYLRTYADVASSEIAAWDHYRWFGWREARNPNVWFTTSSHLDRHPESAQLSGGPLEHLFASALAGQFWHRLGFTARSQFLRSLGSSPATPESLLKVLLPNLREVAGRNGWSFDETVARVHTAIPELPGIVKRLQAGEFASYGLLPRFVAPEWYREAYLDAIGSTSDPAEHYLRDGWREQRDPNPWFSCSWYLAANPEAGQPDQSPLEHFLVTGASRGNSPHPGFHLGWYARRYLPGAPLAADILLHFLETGARNGAVPDPRLDTADVRLSLEETPAEQRAARIRELYEALPSEAETLASLIDGDWYYDRYPDVQEAQADPLPHYLHHGWREDRDPNPWFSTSSYLEQHPDVAEADICPLVHYVRAGAAEGFRPSPHFDASWYAKHYLGAASPSTSTLVHLLTVGIQRGNVPEPALHRADVLEQLAACPVNERTGLLHRLRRTIVEWEPKLIDALVDRDWYKRRYGDTGPDLVAWYREKGWREGHDPNPWFCAQWYLNVNPDARQQGVSPLDHFVRTGAAKGRRPHPFFDIEWYSAHYMAAPPRAEALLHFMTVGSRTGAVPHPFLATEAMRKRLRQMSPDERTAFFHKCEKLLSVQPSPHLLTRDDIDIWAALLMREGPSDSLAVLLLYQADPDGETGHRMRGAAMALAPEESAVFGLIHSETTLRLSSSLDSPGLSVDVRLPAQLEELRDLLLGLRCRRAAAIGTDLLDTAVVRFVRKAGVPVFTNNTGA